MTPDQVDHHYTAQIAAHVACDCPGRVPPAITGAPERCRQWVELNAEREQAWLNAAARKVNGR